MEFKKFSAGANSYGKSKPPQSPSKIQNVCFNDDEIWDVLKNKDDEKYKDLEQVLVHLSLCHSIIIDERTGKYNASSPDELALVNGAKFFNVVYESQDVDHVITVNVFDEKR